MILSKFARGLVLATIAAATLLVVTIASKPADKDFIAYWSAGHRLVEHQNPYSHDGVFELEKHEGLRSAKPLIMRNPPWALFLVYPLGYVSPRVGLIFWMAAALGTVALCLRIFEVPARERLLGFCFAPVYASIAVGQSSPFLLLGFTLFIMLHHRHPFFAGSALLLVMAKPHLFLIFLPVILLDSFYRRSYRVLAGAAAAIATASVLITLFDIHIWAYYLEMLRTSGIEADFIPTAIGTVSVLFFPHHPIMQFVPAAIAMLWATWFYWKKREHWNWRTDSMLLLLVTVLVSPYAWMTDEIVLLPAVLFAVCSPYRAKHTFAIFMAINTVALTMLMEQVQLPSGYYAWTSIAWIALFLYSRSGSTERMAVLRDTPSFEEAEAA